MGACKPLAANGYKKQAAVGEIPCASCVHLRPHWYNEHLPPGGRLRFQCGLVLTSSRHTDNYPLVSGRGTCTEAELKDGKGVRAPAVSRGVLLIAAERKRQVAEEGWTAANDAGDNHQESEMAQVAGYYALRIRNALASTYLYPTNWDPKGMKREGFPYPTDRDLVKAGALIAAELDRRLAGGKAE